MKEYVEREAILKEQQEICYWNGLEDRYDDFVPVQIIEKVPSAKVTPIIYAYWDWQHDGTHFCSECGTDALWTEDGREFCSLYCPHCGRQMTFVAEQK